MTLEYNKDSFLDIEDFNWGNLNKIEIDFVEMNRQKIRIAEIGDECVNKLSSLAIAVSALAALVNAEGYSDTSMSKKITTFKNYINLITGGMQKQIDDYSTLNNEINQEIVNEINKIISVLIGKYSSNETSQFIDEFNSAREKATNEYQLNNLNTYNTGDSDLRCLDEKFGGSAEKWDVLDQMYKYFSEKGCTDEQIAGIIGNAVQESGLVLDIKNPNSTAKGLFQWLDMRLYNGESNQPSSWDIQTQLDHAWYQIETKRDMQGVSVLEHLNDNSTSVSGSAQTFATFFEGVGSDQYGHRTEYANAVYAYIKNNINNSDTEKLSVL